MQQALRNLFFFFLLVWISGCASVYHPIEPLIVSYQAPEYTDSIGFSYRYELLREVGNRKYARKEEKAGIRVVAVQIANNSSKKIKLGENLSLYAGEDTVQFITPHEVRKKLKQRIGFYFLYLAPSFYNPSVTNGASEQVVPLGIIVGPGLTFLNIFIAASSNSNLEKELELYNMQNVVIEPGESAKGLVSISANNSVPLYLRLKK